MKIFQCFLYGLLLLTFLACSGDKQILELESGGVLFQDDFSHRQGGWPTQVDVSGITDYLGEAYLIQVLVPYTDRQAHPGLNLTDAHVQVETTHISGSTNNRFGVFCRYRNPNNYYLFLLSTDGYYAVIKALDGQIEILGTKSMQRHENFSPNQPNNLIDVICVGHTLKLLVNGAHITILKDSDHQSGDVGLMVGTFNESETEILFDNFKVLQP